MRLLVMTYSQRCANGYGTRNPLQRSAMTAADCIEMHILLR